MSDFDYWLDPDGLDDQATALDSWADGMASIARSMAQIVLSSEAGATTYSNATGVCKTVHTGLLGWLAHMQNVFNSMSRELRSVAEEGRGVEIATAARMDLHDAAEYNGYSQQYPSIYVGGYKKTYRPLAPAIAPAYDRVPLGSNDMPAPKWSETRGGSYFIDAPPGSFTTVGHFAVTILDKAVLDPAGEIKEALMAMGITRTRESIFSGFGGGWWALAEYAYVLNGLSSFLDEMRSALVQIFGGIAVYWQGYAANSAGLYFEDVLTGVTDVSDACLGTATEVTKYIESVKSYADIIGGFLEDLAIDAYMAALAIALGKKVGTPLIFAGGPIADGVATWLKITGQLSDMLLIVDSLQTAVGLEVELQDVTSKLHVLEMVETS